METLKNTQYVGMRGFNYMQSNITFGYKKMENLIANHK